MDMKDFVNCVQKLVNVATDKKWIKGEDLPLFTTRWHFFTSEEWYARLVAPYFANYAEFGIQEGWLRFELIRNTFYILDAVKEWWLKDTDDKKKTFVNTGQILGHLLWSSNQMFEHSVRPKPIKIDHFAVLASPMLYIMGIAGIVFLGEIFYKESLSRVLVFGRNIRFRKRLIKKK